MSFIPKASLPYGLSSASQAEYVKEMKERQKIANQIYPLEPYRLLPNALPDNVVVSRQLWCELYGILRLYPEGIELKQLGIDYVISTGKPLGGVSFYRMCHVQTLHKLFVALPDVHIIEIRDGTIGYKLRRPDESDMSVTTKNVKSEKIRNKPSSLKRSPESLKMAVRDAEYSSGGEDFEYFDWSDDDCSLLSNTSPLPPQPRQLLSKGSDVPDFLRYRIYRLLKLKFADGIDIVTFNERYQQEYKQCINPTVRCNVDMPQLFRSMSDILHIGYGERNLMYVKPRSFREIESWRYDPVEYEQTSLDNFMNVKKDILEGWGSVSSRQHSSSAGSKKNAKDIDKDPIIAKAIEAVTKKFNQLDSSENELIDVLYEVSDPVRKDVMQIGNLLNFFKRRPDKFSLFERANFVFVKIK